jgi:hypothetical protein
MAPAVAESRDPAYRIRNVKVGRYTFDADFDSGNCARVEMVGSSPDDVHVWTAADCAGTAYEPTTARSWFYFSVRGGVPGTTISITVNNVGGLNLYKHDFRPVFRHGESGEWQRLKKPVSAAGSKKDNDCRINFKHRFEGSVDEPVFFAFTYPWSFADGQAQLAALEARYGAVVPADGSAFLDAVDAPAAAAGDIYFRRELLTRSLEGRQVDLLTITSTKGLDGAREEPIDGLFPPDADGGGAAARPHAFGGRRVFVISSRVHPGEVPAAHVLNGFLEFLLRADDPRARAMRETFVVKVVACLNPDGVYHGHYRLDTRGVNLNRCYAEPDAALHPSIFAMRALLAQLHARNAFEFHVDLHAHANKRGVFLFGNNFGTDSKAQVEAVLYTKLVALNSQTVDFDGCTFSQGSMGSQDRRGQSKEGASRVAIYRLTGATHCYTLECNYDSGRMPPNKLSEPVAGRTISPPPIAPGTIAPKYTPKTWEEVGRALAVGALDLVGANPSTRCAPRAAPARAASRAVRRMTSRHPCPTPPRLRIAGSRPRGACGSTRCAAGAQRTCAPISSRRRRPRARPKPAAAKAARITTTVRATPKAPHLRAASRCGARAPRCQPSSQRLRARRPRSRSCRGPRA